MIVLTMYTLKLPILLYLMNSSPIWVCLMIAAMISTKVFFQKTDEFCEENLVPIEGMSTNKIIETQV